MKHCERNGEREGRERERGQGEEGRERVRYKKQGKILWSKERETRCQIIEQYVTIEK